MPSLIHLSDLHRSPDEPIDNDTLLAAISADVDRYSTLHEPPEALIVSGDLVQGVGPGEAAFEREMRGQYEVAIDLISRLTDEIFSGDRTKVIIVPGNHDVCWNTSAQSMEIVAEDAYPENIRASLSRRDGPYRWSWKERRLYRVANVPVYEQRLAAYWDAVENFYLHAALKVPIDRSRGYQIFEACNGDILFAAFETTHRNDHLRYEAELSTGVVSRCAMHIKRLGANPSLLAAVWHHSIHGAPSKEDYLNIESIREMVGLGFQLGFHGHQHIAESTDLSVSVGGGSTMCVTSSGSLCASWHDLPRGTDRQYNIVRIDKNFETGALFVREMAEGSQFVSRSKGRFVDGMVPLKWTPRADAGGRVGVGPAKKIARLTVDIEEANQKGESSPATAELLALQPMPGTYPRQVLLAGLTNDKNWDAILSYYWPSDEPGDAIAAANASYELGNPEKLSLILASGKIPTMVRDSFEARLEMLKRRGRG